MLYNIFESLKKQTIIRSFNINQFNPKNVLKQPASPLINQSDPYLHPISDCVVDNEHCETNAHHIVFINQSFNHPINQPLNQSTTQSTTQSINQPVPPSSNRLRRGWLAQWFQCAPCYLPRRRRAKKWLQHGEWSSRKSPDKKMEFIYNIISCFVNCRTKYL